MVGIVKNYTHIKARILSIRADPESDAMDILELHVLEKSAHQDFPDLLMLNSSDHLTVYLKQPLTHDLKLQAGMTINALVRAGGGGRYFADGSSIVIL